MASKNKSNKGTITIVDEAGAMLKQQKKEMAQVRREVEQKNKAGGKKK